MPPFSNRHNIAYCWNTHPEKQSKNFRKKYPDAESLKKALEEIKKVNEDRQKTYPQKSLRVTNKLTTETKDNKWYLDTNSRFHTTYGLKNYLHPNPNDSREIIRPKNGDLLHTRGARTTTIEVTVEGTSFYIHTSKVHYCPEMTSNRLSLRVFGTKGC